MKRYRLAAFDMDGTLLNSEKRMTPRTLTAIRTASAAGKHVAVATGRSLAEMRDYLEDLSDVRWLISCSGAYVYDLFGIRQDGSCPCIFRALMEPEIIIRCMDVVRDTAYDGFSPMANLLSAESYVQSDQQSHMHDYGMGVYQGLYDRVTTKLPDLYAFYTHTPFPAGKLNFYHDTPQSRERTRARLTAAGLADTVEMVDAETTSLECSPKGLNKAAGLRALSTFLDIPMDEMIAVGDADNDLAMLEAAGLAAAMGNANAHVRAAADVIVRDNDHDGCAEVIAQYLL